MALGQTFWAYVGPKNFLVDAGCPAPLGRERDEPLETRDYAMCVTKFRRCRSNRLNVGGKFQKTGDAGALTPWDGGVTTPKIRYSATCVIVPNFVVSDMVGCPKILGDPVECGPARWDIDLSDC